MNALVTGAGGFIGGHLVKHLIEQGDQVTAVDIKPLDEWFQLFREADNRRLDLREAANARRAVWKVQWLYNLAASMGGMGFIESHKAECMLNVLINTNLLMAAREIPEVRFFFSSSACAYAITKQSSRHCPALRESDAYPAVPEDGYGWEKLFSERMCENFAEDYGTDVRIARLHNIYGPNGTWNGGREKAPAAICRKVIEAKLSGKHEIEIWGDGEQVRSFTWIDDCIEGICRIMDGGFFYPLNLGSSERVTINQLVDMVEEIAGIKLKRNHKLLAPMGVVSRSSDNTLIRTLYDWEPSTLLRTGIAQLYDWIERQMQ